MSTARARAAAGGFVTQHSFPATLTVRYPLSAAIVSVHANFAYSVNSGTSAPARSPGSAAPCKWGRQIRVAITHLIGSSGHFALRVLTCRTACTRKTVSMLRRTPGCTELVVATNPSWVHDARAQPHQILTNKTTKGRRLRCSLFHIEPLLLSYCRSRC